MTRGQCRAARGLLGWTLTDLANASEVNLNTISKFERGDNTPRPSTLKVLQRALEDAGIEFIPGNGKGAGVRFARGSGNEDAG